MADAGRSYAVAESGGVNEGRTRSLRTVSRHPPYPGLEATDPVVKQCHSNHKNVRNASPIWLRCAGSVRARHRSTPSFGFNSRWSFAIAKLTHGVTPR